MCIINFLTVLILLGMLVTKSFGKVTYDMRLESIVATDGEEETLIDLHGIKLVGRERRINGTFILKTDMTDEFIFFLDLYTFKNGAWTPMPYGVQEMPSCEFFKNFFIKYFDPESQNTNIPKTIDGYCPFPKGQYWIINGAPNTEKWVSYVRRGLGKMVFQMRKDGKAVGGFDIVGNVIDSSY